MSKNIKLNDTEYTGVSTVQLPTTDGGTAFFKDTDEITTQASGFELKGTYTVNSTGYFYAESTIDQAILTPSYEAGIIVLVADSADEDWTDNANGIGRMFVLYTSSKYIIISQAYRSGTGEQNASKCAPVERSVTGAGNPITITSLGNTYVSYLNEGQSVKKYEMELDSASVEALLYYTE